MKLVISSLPQVTERLLWMINQGAFRDLDVIGAEAVQASADDEDSEELSDVLHAIQQLQPRPLQPIAAPSRQESSHFVQDLIEARVHFGHRTSRWNPKMKPYIFGERQKLHIIDIRQTLKAMLFAKRLISKIVGRGEDVLFVGTKRQARSLVEEAGRRCGMPFVSERWLGGILTNFRTIRSRLQRLEELETLLNSPDLSKLYSKKRESSLKREYLKISRNLSGIRAMSRLPGALFVIDATLEQIAIREARRLNIPVMALIDTDGNPDLVDLPIPGNDDSSHAIEIVLREIVGYTLSAKEQRIRPAEEDSRTARIGRRRKRIQPEVAPETTELPAPEATDDHGEGGIAVTAAPGRYFR